VLFHEKDFTKISDIHSYFKIKSIKSWSDELLIKFTKAKRGHDLIAADLEEFQNEIDPRNRKNSEILQKQKYYDLTSERLRRLYGEPCIPVNF